MLFPTNPEKRPELWSKFTEKVLKGKISFIIHNNKHVPEDTPEKSLAERAEQVISSFQSADIVRFGSSHGQAIGPFFALFVVDGVAHVAEYAIDRFIQSRSNRDVQEAIQSLAINLFVERKDIAEISIPLSLAGWGSHEWTFVHTDKNTTLRRSA